ncbi:putative membrane protein [Propionispora sp. 2/2-37]|uniref:nickel pincer cofactor biosynthesis protein LarB n=1 Tax=Propionispora sp. 2/2-37 TaxID=1677858 RepID=UPI0006BB7A54|nr:nickel pincer cofactor biosynthesis protein LarB [Propionispora sp. 2/2-37]CUH95413.1 putative membrane protein [Propionispora sp. 2/2-37]
MNKRELITLLQEVQSRKIEIDEAVQKLEDLPFKDLGFAAIDNHREIRVGYPEVIYCAGKTVDQVREIIQFMLTRENHILATRASDMMYQAVKEICPDACYNELGRVITIKRTAISLSETYIAIVAAGTSDLPVVEEAAETAMMLGNRVEKVIDVGVAGIHRLFARLETIRKAKVVIVVAGMEGALASVVGGLVDKPIIAVPTSVGYGSSFGGIAALLTMLNSCASGISVVNIDNGFGAGYCASMINKL